MKSLFILLFGFAVAFCGAQNSYQAGFLPSINLNKKLPGDYKLNFKLESRQEIAKGFFNQSSNYSYNYLLTDFSLITAKKIAINKTIAIGYLARLREGELIHRGIQQFIITKAYSGFKLSHRIATDQTFTSSEATEYRFRYRLSSAISLNGQSVDPKEFYLKINNEYLNSFENKDYDLEIRLVPMLGYQFSNTNKLEFGLDYRINAFLKGNTRHRFWLGVNWYLSI